ncbi:beta-alanine transporter-like [Anopheles bellator]|uniref:beta-alanine transporter-like n=1 Tax=Anopheles bellator TaxID=139047 RepID=UPI0026475736|nr:beta-alanine transporter-like [Anopheles bellator]
MTNAEASFDEMLAQAGDDGRFQRRYNLLFNFGAVCFASMTYMSIILALNKPPHNCHVPGMERYNITDAEYWKNLTLPRESDNRGMLGFSKCQMYNVSEEHLQRPYAEWSFQESDIIDCAHGYEYDRTYYDRTPITEHDWICDKGFRETNIFIYNRLGELVGTVVFGQLGDTLGRRPVYYLSVLIITLGRLVSMFTAGFYVVFCIAAIAGSLTAHSCFQAPFIIAMEISKSERRGTISMMQSFGWTTGMCILPMVFWATKDWFWALMIVTLPIVIFTGITRYQIESPRWMATRGDYAGAMKMLRRIATINGVRELPYDEHILQKRLATHRTDTVYGVASLFSGWRMARNTMLVVLCWTVGSVLYFTLVLLSARMDGNPFLNFMLQSIIEVPAALIGQRCSDRFGRRATNATAFCAAALTCGALVLIVRDPALESLATILATLVKFFISITFFAVNLQSIEIYPTCLRQTGMAFGTIASTLFGTVGPYLVYLGTEYDVRIPFLVMGLSAAIGIFAGLFLPETLHQALPNTIEEARNFGKHQRFWSLPKAPAKKHADAAKHQRQPEAEDARETVRLNVPEDETKQINRE